MNVMPRELPQTASQVFLTDGGLETTLIFRENIDLPDFAAFGLVLSESGKAVLHDYYQPYLDIAREAGCGFILESPTWRASADWGNRQGYDSDQMRFVNREAIAVLQELRERGANRQVPVVISGCVGPRGDGYVVGERMSPGEAQAYHEDQVGAFAESDADMISAMTITYPEEAIGITRAAQDAGLPVVISFTTETDGRLPDGSSLADAIARVDAATDAGPAYYMVNCAHPEHFSQAFEEGAGWVQRVRGIRANASRMSHAELDECEHLDDGDPEELGGMYRELRSRFPWFTVLGGCCGTDERHIQHACPAH